MGAVNGVCYGVLGDNLPSRGDVVQLLKSEGIGAMRIYYPDKEALDALRGSGIAVTIDVGDSGAVFNLANNPAAAADWVRDNVVAYWPGVIVRYVVIGNELPAGHMGLVLPAMKNVHKALMSAGLSNSIKVSTAVKMDVVSNTFPPSNGVFRPDLLQFMAPVARFLANTVSPLLVNVYPYLSYRDNPRDISLSYATFQPGATVRDDGNGLTYTNLFSAMVDSVYAALEKAGAPNVRIVVSESGWPSAGGFAASVENARNHNQGVIDNVMNGTPKRPGPLESYVFAMFNENQKTGHDETVRHFGLFNSDKTPAYAITHYPRPPVQSSIGVCYGMLGNDLPSRSEVVQMYISKGISGMRIYNPDREALDALRNSGIGLILDAGGFDAVSYLAASPSNAAAWVRDNVRPYYPAVSIKYIAVGNEVVGGTTESILPAMRNVNDALAAAGLGGIKVSTAVKSDVIANSYPPSAGVFAYPYMKGVAQFLASTGAPLLANVYPYFAYTGNPREISLNYATFRPGTTVRDDGSGLTYTNLFDAMVDCIYAALEKAGAGNVRVVVSESGWPSAEGVGASMDNARAYNQGLIDHVGRGTPKRPGQMEAYIFAMFNENQKTGASTERHFGLFYPNKSPVYQIAFPN
uniref:Glucan endo-1,3-beta-D-glucosidase n=1 Tax=Oryza brachyantha TaxID=4533 RepID=J3L7S6_ORYBR